MLTKPLEISGQPITLAFSKSNRAFLSERMTGNLWELDLSQEWIKEQPYANSRLVYHFPIVPLVGHQETGLLGIALDPDFETTKYIYCYYTAGSSASDFKNRIVRIKDDGTGEEVILDNIPAGMIHNGGVLVFGQDNILYIGVGVNNFEKDKSQDIKFLGGKILRINRDGSIPKDNPYPGSPVYSYGHRNIFGLAVHPKTGIIYACDVGPDHDDEINIIQKGGNYGWPIIMGRSDDDKFVNPIKTYTPVITPTQSVFVGNDLYIGSYNEGKVRKLTLSGANFDQVEKDEVVYDTKTPWSVNGVFRSPDGHFYVTAATELVPFTLSE